MDDNIRILLILTYGFALATLLGYAARRLKLPTILGYLVAGYVIGPHCPGYSADPKVAEQLAEIGIILMLFGVGIHFKPEQLFAVRKLAIPGALLQTTVATIATVLLSIFSGFSLTSGILLGLAIGVASTFVMAGVLSQNNLLETKEGHIAIGWLVVEDIITVIVLALLPLIASYEQTSSGSATLSVLTIAGKLIILCVGLFTIGYRFIRLILERIAAVHSQELFTIAVLAVVFLIAVGSALVFGASLALGAFLAGMIIGKTNVKHQAAANALSLKDTFSIVFFLSVGMLLNPSAPGMHLSLFFGVLFIILILKPLTAFVLVMAFGLPIRTALTVALALTQIGEFSFILAEQAGKLGLFPKGGYDVIVTCAFLSISLNPVLFRYRKAIETSLQKISFLKKILVREKNHVSETIPEERTAVIIGYGPVGKEMVKTLQEIGYQTTVIEKEIEAITDAPGNSKMIYGDASYRDLLKEAGLPKAEILIITTLDGEEIAKIVAFAKEENPDITVLVRIKYLSEASIMHDIRVKYVCSETESAKALRQILLRQ